MESGGLVQSLRDVGGLGVGGLAPTATTSTSGLASALARAT